jgi:hypothetical protein
MTKVELENIKEVNEKSIAFTKKWWIDSHAKPFIVRLIEENREIKRQLKGVS